MSGRPPKVTDEELEEFRSRGLNAIQIADLLRERGIKISKQAIYARLNKLGQQVDRSRILPWEVRAIHANNNRIYASVLAYGKWRNAQQLSDYERKLALEFEEAMTSLGHVLLYDPHRGFVTRDRRPDDGPSALVVT